MTCFLPASEKLAVKPLVLFCCCCPNRQFEREDGEEVLLHRFNRAKEGDFGLQDRLMRTMAAAQSSMMRSSDEYMLLMEEVDAELALGDCG
jgi:hypothetical protein